jgi:aryl-alcohol dehydrogenase-like predicted oxidoreductase
MRKRQLGNTDLELTTVGLGTWAIGGPWQMGWGPQDDDEAIATILHAINEGINWIDTAAIYGLGHSEELVGKALKQTTQKPLIATKCGLLWDDQGRKENCLTSESIRKECDASLKRLSIEVIDLYQIHHPQPDEDIEQAWEEMTRLVQQGKVRYIGVSNFNIEQIERVCKIHAVASLQPKYNMLHRQVEEQLLAYCAQNNIGVIVYSPMARGLLTGKFSQERLSGLPLDDHRRRNQDFHDPRFTATLQLVDYLQPIAERNGKTVAQLAISWVLRPIEVTAAIVGARKPEQIAETCAAPDWSLTDEDVQEIEQLLDDWRKKIE